MFYPHILVNMVTKSVKNENWFSSRVIPYKSRMRPLNPNQKENLWEQIVESSNLQWVPERYTTGTGDEEGQEDKVGHRPERAEKADSQEQLTPHYYMYRRSYTVCKVLQCFHL